MAARWRRALEGEARTLRGFIVAAFLLAWMLTVIFHDPEILPLPPKMDPMSRVAGWPEIAAHLNELRQEQHADVLIADAYKEASVLSFNLPDHAFIYTLRHKSPATEYDFWPSYPKQAPHRALWITEQSSPRALRRQFNTITLLEHVEVSFRGSSLRDYDIYLCENR